MIVPVELAAVDVCTALQIRFCWVVFGGRPGQQTSGVGVGVGALANRAMRYGEGGNKKRVKERACEHRNHAQENLLYALDGAPAFRGLFVHQRVVARVVQDRNADVAVWVDCEDRTVRTRWMDGRHPTDGRGKKDIISAAAAWWEVR